MNMNNLKGFVFYVDILGFSALTQGKIQLTEDDFNIWQVSKHFQTSGNQEFTRVRDKFCSKERELV